MDGLFSAEVLGQQQTGGKGGAMLTKRGSFILALVVLAWSLLGSNSLLAQDQDGADVILLARGRFAEGTIKIAVDAPVDVAQLMVTVSAGTQIDWHYHPGYELFQVKTGALTEYLDMPGCPWTVYPAGSVFFSAESHVHKIVNETEGTTEFFPTFIVPPDSPTIYFVTPKYCGQ
jgi:quercetin dioxygenase-like cupin family protein